MVRTNPLEDGGTAHEGLHVRGLVTGYHRQRALHGVDLDVRPGTICAVIGPNGAGKTTLIRAIMGELPAWEGRIFWGGQDLNGLSPRVRVGHGVAIVPQGAECFPSLSIYQNLMVSARVSGEKADVGDRIGRALDLFPELASRTGVSAADLSGGQKQMLAIARALVQEPRLLLVDEPSFGLAVGVRARVVDVLKRYSHEQGGTVLLAEQDSQMVAALADEACFMRHGSAEAIPAAS